MIESLLKKAMKNNYDLAVSCDSGSGRYTVTLHRFSETHGGHVKVFEMSASELEPCIEQVENILSFSRILNEVEND